MNLADRILVMYEGRVVGEVDAATATETQLGLLMTGSGNTGGRSGAVSETQETGER